MLGSGGSSGLGGPAGSPGSALAPHRPRPSKRPADDGDEGDDDGDLPVAKKKKKRPNGVEPNICVVCRGRATECNHRGKCNRAVQSYDLADYRVYLARVCDPGCSRCDLMRGGCAPGAAGAWYVYHDVHDVHT